MICGFSDSINIDDDLDPHGHLEIKIAGPNTEDYDYDWITRKDAEQIIKHLKELFTI